MIQGKGLLCGAVQMLDFVSSKEESEEKETDLGTTV